MSTSSHITTLKKKPKAKTKNAKKTNIIIDPLDPGMSFLHNVLPNMKPMNDTQKLCFKFGQANTIVHNT